MTGTKHTSGPWFVDQFGHVYGWEKTPTGKESVLLVDGRHSVASFADKLIMAAALELLEALSTLLDMNDNSGPFGGELYQDRVDRAWDNARAAIAKARGGNSH